MCRALFVYSRLIGQGNQVSPIGLWYREAIISCSILQTVSSVQSAHVLGGCSSGKDTGARAFCGHPGK